MTASNANKCYHPKFRRFLFLFTHLSVIQSIHSFSLTAQSATQLFSQSLSQPFSATTRFGQLFSRILWKAFGRKLRTKYFVHRTKRAFGVLPNLERTLLWPTLSLSARQQIKWTYREHSLHYSEVSSACTVNSIFAVYYVESLLIGKFGWLIGWLIVHRSPTNCNNRQHGADNDTDVKAVSRPGSCSFWECSKVVEFGKPICYALKIRDE